MQAADTRAPSPPAGANETTGHARVIFVPEGPYRVRLIGGVDPAAVQLSTPPSAEFGRVEIVASSGALPGSFAPSGGAITIRSPPGGGVILLTICGAGEPVLDIRRTDAPDTAAAAGDAEPAERGRPGTGIACEIVLHIESQGDRRFVSGGWVGNRGRRLRVEAFSVRPLERLTPADIEYRGFGPGGRETPWVTGGLLCGTRGRGLPLTGFAVRVAPGLREQFEAVYEGAFFASGAVGPMRDGEPCRPPLPDDPLEAVNLRIVGRRTPKKTGRPR